MRTIKYLFIPMLFSLVLISCSREEPIVKPVVIEPTIIKMNEIYSRGVTDNPDWIEIYNQSSKSVDISGYKIYDVGGQGGTKPKLEIPANTVVPSKGYYVIVTDIPTATNPAGFGLSSGGEEVWLEDKSDTIIDHVAFIAMETTQSYSRVPDGGSWVLTNNITRGSANK